MARFYFRQKHISLEMITILSIILIAGAVFLLIPAHFFDSEKEKALKLTYYDTSDITGIVMFVSSRKQNESLEEILAYKILTHMKQGKNKEGKRAWLIHGGTLDEDGSSYRNTIDVISAFKDSGLKLKPAGIENILDANESFQLINDIFSRQLYGMDPKQIVCDFTSGTKLMTLGMALACAGNKKLVYFPKTNEVDAAQYIHVETENFLTTSHT